MQHDYDVVISGAGLAGCATAVLLNEIGLRTLIVERRRSAEHYKRLCGHYILGSAQSTLNRLGIHDSILEAGGTQSTTRAWSQDGGWVMPPGGEIDRAISLERSHLDPILRKRASESPLCDVAYGASVATAATSRDGSINLEISQSSARRAVRTRLLVGADGSSSRVANLVGAQRTTLPNNRFMYWAYFENARLHDPGTSQVWMLDPDVAVAFPTNHGKVQVGYFGHIEQLAQFEPDIVGEIAKRISVLPQAPDLSKAKVLRGPVGTPNYPLIERPAVPAPGVALVGDAALTSDPVVAVGCSWALRSAEFLADSLVGFAAGTTSLDDCLAQYQQRHSFFRRHQRLISIDSKNVRSANSVQRSVRRAATVDSYVATEMTQYINQNRTAMALLKPKILGRILKAKVSSL
ncbi:NAD(P)/FAD-dependent oxidoreductase [Prescottella equi]